MASTALLLAGLFADLGPPPPAGELEPFDSHPYVVDLKLEYPSWEPELADKIFAALVADGYQVIVLRDGGMIRSSHYREDGGDAGPTQAGSQGGLGSV